MIEIGRNAAERLVTIRASGTLTGNDLAQALTEIEQAIEEANGGLNAVIILQSVEVRDFEAMWSGLKFDVKHHDSFVRIAIVGSPKFLETGAQATDLATGAKVEFFLNDQLDEANDWARAG